jgi:DNA-binding NtrC family response regulator
VPPAAGGPPWWHVEFFPLMGDEGVLGILGRIQSDAVPPPPKAPRVPEAWAALREQTARRFDFDLWASELPAMHCVVAQARLAAQSRCPVRIVGEAGTGKQWLARTIHFQGVTAAAPFVALDCARLPPAALAGVLSGPLGLDRPAGAGTLYLREPSALEHDWQHRLADHLADAGDRGPRLIAGVRADPAAEVRAGRLLDRLGAAFGVVAITLPPLRERAADLPLLVERMLPRVSAALEQPVTGLTPDAHDCLRAYRWPGNLRELFTTLLGAGGRAADGRIDAAHLPLPLLQAGLGEGPPAKAAPRLPALDALLEEVEKRMIQLALAKTGGHQTKAAELLAVWRPRLSRRIKALGLGGDEPDAEGA